MLLAVIRKYDFLLFCHMYFYRICVLYRLRRRAQHKMRGEVPGMKMKARLVEKMCVKRIACFIFARAAVAARWCDNIKQIYVCMCIHTLIQIFVCMCICG